MRRTPGGSFTDVVGLLRMFQVVELEHHQAPHRNRFPCVRARREGLSFPKRDGLEANYGETSSRVGK